jgi:PDZ domain-containing protein
MRWVRRPFWPGCIALLVAAVFLARLPFFLERPRPPIDLSAAVEVAAPVAEPIEGDYLLTAVSLRRASPFDLVLAWVDDDAELVSVARLLPQGTADRTYFDTQREVFAQSADLAAAVGLDAAGYQVFLGAGVRVVEIVPGSPAEGRLEAGDVLVAVDGDTVLTTLDLVELLTAPAQDGQRRIVTVQRGDEVLDVVLVPRPLDGDIPQIGVQIETVDPRIELPFPVTVDAGRIGGPSAGLMVALTVYDMVEDANLAGGRRIAGTGAIQPDGAVTRIGGLPQKLAGASRARASVFLVPDSQLEEALGAVPRGSSLQVVGVASFDEAVDALGAGGRAGP